MKFAYATEAPNPLDDGMFAKVVDALTAIGIPYDMQACLCHVLASVMHVGNVEFADADVPGKVRFVLDHTN